MSLPKPTIYLTSSGSLFSFHAKKLSQIVGRHSRLRLANARVVYITTAIEHGRTNFLSVRIANHAQSNLAKLAGSLVTATFSDPDDLARKIKDADLVYIAGGETFYLIQEAKRYFPAKEDLIGLIGHRPLITCSASSIAMGPDVGFARIYRDNPALAPQLKDETGYGIVPFSPLVHYNAVIGRLYAHYLSRHPEQSHVIGRPIHDGEEITFP